MLRIYQRMWQVNWAEQWQYRANLLMYLLYWLVSPIVYLAVWTTVATSQGSVKGFSANDFATYYMTLLLVDQVTSEITIHILAYKIQDGTLSGDLLKPIHPILTGTLVNNLAFKVLTMFVLIPVWMILFLLFRPDFSSVTPESLLLAVPALLLGFCINFLFGAAITCVAFWTTRVYALSEFYYALLVLFAGQFVPLDLLPPLVQGIARYLPFQLLRYFPIQLILGKLPPETILRNFLLDGVWLAAALAFFMFVWRRGLKRFSAVELKGLMFKLFTAFLKVNIQMALAYRAETVMTILLNLMWIGWELLSLSIIFSNTPTLGGWGPGELIALLGVFRLVNTLMASLIWPNTEKFNSSIRDGSFDYTLLQPVNSLFLVSFSRMVIWRVWDLILAATLIIIGLSMSGGGPSPLNLLGFLVLALSGMLIIYSLWIVLIALTFWFTKFDNNVTILQALLDAGRYPATVYPFWLRLVVTFLVPIALATTVPLQALRGDLSAATALGYLVIGIASFLFASRVWKAGIRRYSGASS